MMKKPIPLFTLQNPLVLGALIFLLIPVLAFSQFSVVSTVPADGAALVDTTLTMQITFNAPLDTSARFQYPNNLFINLGIAPEGLYTEPDSVTLSADMQTVFLHNFQLEPDTKYLIMVVNAVSSAGDSLLMPYMLTFTTGADLPVATVSGTVSMPGVDVTGSAVILLTNSLYGPEEMEAESAGIVIASNGEYTAKYIAPGVYWPAALKNFYFDNYNMVFPAADGCLGFYDPDNNGAPDSIIVTAGAQLTGIDITMQAASPVTARSNYPAIADSAQSWAADAGLNYIMAYNVSPAGKTQMWFYIFHSVQLSAYRSWVTLGSLIFALDMDPEDSPADSVALPDNWLDSDVIMDSAAVHGGNDFFLLYPDAVCDAFLANFELPYIFLDQKRLPMPRNSRLSLPAGISINNYPVQHQRHSNNPSLPVRTWQTLTPVWGIYYYSEAAGQELILFFDAVSGEYIPPFEMVETTARYNLEAAGRAAQNWSPDALLIAVDCYTSELLETGEAIAWDYYFYSPGLDSVKMFVLCNKVLFLEGTPDWEILSIQPLPEDWIDSNMALAVAELNGGSQYRAVNEYPWVIANLSRGIFPIQPDSAVWEFDYLSDTAEVLTIFVDARTGNYLPTAIKPGAETGKTPQNYALYQNFPNPFNPDTQIQYQLPEKADVTLKIYNRTGQLVKVLADQEQQPGIYTLSWDGKDAQACPAASGIYFYKLTAGSFEQTRAMILVR